MRDKKRIKKTIRLLEDLWDRHPDMRLGQLLENFIFKPEEMFYQEDEETGRNLTKQK